MEPTFPVTISTPACDCIRGLLRTDENLRLGSSSEGAKEIMATDFFSLYDFEAIYRKEVVPPFKPDVRSEVDTTYIPSVYLEEKATDSFVSPNSASANNKNNANFEEFSFNGGTSI